MVYFMENPTNKWMIWGYPYFWKHPNRLSFWFLFLTLSFKYQPKIYSRFKNSISKASACYPVRQCALYAWSSESWHPLRPIAKKGHWIKGLWHILRFEPLSKLNLFSPLDSKIVSFQCPAVEFSEKVPHNAKSFGERGVFHPLQTVSVWHMYQETRSWSLDT